MTREIKFRAWDPKGTFNNGTPCMHMDVTGTTMFDYIWHSDDFPKMQFTGIQDRNGKEIYESDIVKVKIRGGYSQHFEDIECIKKVEYSEEKVCWKPFDVCHMWRDESGTFIAIEVIGNTYENPELLEATV